MEFVSGMEDEYSRRRWSEESCDGASVVAGC